MIENKRIILITLLLMIIFPTLIFAEEVKCTRDYCDRQYGEDYYCNPEVGCVKVNILKTCGPGQCCIAGGNYKVQKCPVEKTCCLNEFLSPYVGQCRTKCLPDSATINAKGDINNNESNNERGLGTCLLIVIVIILAIAIEKMLAKKKKPSNAK